MTKKFDIIWAHVAENDLKEIIEYIATDSPAHALKILGLRVAVWVILYLFEHTGEDFQSEVFLVT